MRFNYPHTPASKRNKILELVCIEFGVTLDQIKEDRKHKELSEARAAYVYLMRKYTGDTLQRIGIEIKRDHSTVIYLNDKANRLIHSKDFLKTQIENIEKQLLN